MSACPTIKLVPSVSAEITEPELKVKLYIIGKSWELNCMLEIKMKMNVLCVGGWWLDGHIQSTQDTIQRKPKHLPPTEICSFHSSKHNSNLALQYT